MESVDCLGRMEMMLCQAGGGVGGEWWWFKAFLVSGKE